MDDYTKNKSDIRDEITLNLKELFVFLNSKIHIIIAALAVGAIAAFIITRFLITPMYISETQVYIMIRQSDEDGVTFSDLELSSQLSADYREFALSRPVLSEVVEALDFETSVGALEQMITIETAADARILRISITNEDPEHAKEIADTVREKANDRFTEIVGLNSVTTIEEGNLPTSPSSPNFITNIIIGSIIAALLTCLIQILIFILDDSIKTSDDIEYYLGLNVLASIPIRDRERNMHSSSKKKVKKASRKYSH